MPDFILEIDESRFEELGEDFDKIQFRY